MVHSPLSGPRVNIAGWCQDANTDQSQGDGSWWPSNLPKLWWLLCWYHHSKFYHCHSVFLSRSTQSMLAHLRLSVCVCMRLFQLSVTDKLSDGIVLCVMYCGLTSVMPFAWKLEEAEEQVWWYKEYKVSHQSNRQDKCWHFWKPLICRNFIFLFSFFFKCFFIF